MALEHVLFTHTHTFGSSGFTLSGALPAKIPSEVSFQLALTLLASAGDPVDCTGATPAIWARPSNVGAAWVSLGTGTVSGAGNNVLTLTVAKETIPDSWAAYETIEFMVESATGATVTRVYSFGHSVLSDEDTSALLGVYSEDIAPSFATYAINTALTGKPGLRIIVLDTAAGNVTLTLAVFGDGQEVVVVVDGGNNGIVDPDGLTINGVAGTVTLTNGETLHLVEFDGNWLALNPAVQVL